MANADKSVDFRGNIFTGKRPYFIIVALAFLAYLPVLFFNFSYLDDNTLILENQSFLSSFWNIFPAFQTDVFHLFNHSAFYYRPMLTISFIFDYQLGSASPFIYHFTNLVLHLISSCLVYAFFKRLYFRKDLSFFFSLIFAVHPVLSQAVAWIPGRNDSLLAVFLLSMFVFFDEFLNTGKRKYFIWCLIFFAAAVFTKESAILAFPVAIFYLYFINKTKKVSASRTCFFSSWIGIVAVWFLLRHFALKGSAGLGITEMLKSVFLNLPAVIQFIGKIFFPFNLSVLPIIQDTTFVYGTIAVIILLLMFSFTKQKRWPMILFGLGWFFAFLAPSFIRPNSDLAADFIEHRMYVPIIGFFILIMETFLFRRFNLNRKSVIALSAAVISLFGIISIFHIQNFKNRTAFWENAAKNSPHYPLAHRNLGAMLYLDGKQDEAEPEFKKALELNPNEEMAHNNLGLIYMDKGDFQSAEKEFNEELKVNPYYDNAYFNRGLLYYKTERFDEAVDFWKKTLEINPGYSQALYNIFAYYYQKQDKDQSVYWANEAQKMGIPLLPEMQKMLNPTINFLLNK